MEAGDSPKPTDDIPVGGGGEGGGREGAGERGQDDDDPSPSLRVSPSR